MTRRFHESVVLSLFLGLVFLELAPALRAWHSAVEAAEDHPDSYAYYGLGAGKYTTSQRRGRDTWIFWTAGNEKFFRLGTELAGRIGVSIEYLRCSIRASEQPGSNAWD